MGFVILTVGGIAFGGGVGFIFGSFTGQRHALRKQQHGFPVEIRQEG